MQKWCALEKGPWSYACVIKASFLSSCQYAQGSGTPAFLATRHAIVCLDIYTSILKIVNLKMK